MKKILLVFCFLFIVFSSIHAQSWTLVWSDEFNGTSVNTKNWAYDTGAGGWGNAELEDYTPRTQNATISNGNLLIIGRKETYGTSSYTSARMKTQGLQSWTYGRIESRIKLPSGQGLWPAFWMLGDTISSIGWPYCGEIDIMECINTTPEDYGTMHWYNAGGASYGGDTIATSVNTYHTYGIEWDSTAIRWTFDSVQYWEGNIANNVNNTNAFHKPFFILLNMAIGGSWPGNPNGTTTFPDTMYVDWVRVYQQTNLTSVKENEISSIISVYPQPTTGNSTLLISHVQTGNYTLAITDLLGNTYDKETIQASNTNDLRIPLQLNNLAAGVYIITLEKDGILYRTKLVKE